MQERRQNGNVEGEGTTEALETTIGRRIYIVFVTDKRTEELVVTHSLFPHGWWYGLFLEESSVNCEGGYDGAVTFVVENVHVWKADFACYNKHVAESLESRPMVACFVTIPPSNITQLTPTVCTNMIRLLLIRLVA